MSWFDVTLCYSGLLAPLQISLGQGSLCKAHILRDVNTAVFAIGRKGQFHLERSYSFVGQYEKKGQYFKIKLKEKCHAFECSNLPCNIQRL